MGGMSAHVHSQLRNLSTTERMSSGRAQPVKRSSHPARAASGRGAATPVSFSSRPMSSTPGASARSPRAESTAAQNLYALAVDTTQQGPSCSPAERAAASTREATAVCVSIR